MQQRITAVRAVLFDLGDTLWHFPNMPPADVIRGETVRRISQLLAGWGYEMTDERRFLGRDVRLVVEALFWLRDRGYRLGAVTNRGYSGPRFHEEMRELGLTDLFEALVISCNVGYMK